MNPQIRPSSWPRASKTARFGRIVSLQRGWIDCVARRVV